MIVRSLVACLVLSRGLALAQTAPGAAPNDAKDATDAAAAQPAASSSAAASRPEQQYLGVRTTSLPEAVRAQIRELVPREAGLLVTHVVPRSPAERAGIEPYDVLLEAGETSLRSSDDLDGVVAGAGVGAAVDLRIVRGGRRTAVTVAVAPRPAADPAAEREGANLARAVLVRSQSQVPLAQRPDEGVPFATGPLGERAILVTTREADADADAFDVEVAAGKKRWTWTADGPGAAPPDDLPREYVPHVARLLAGLRAERERQTLRLRVQPRADADSRSVVLLLQHPGEGREFRLFEIEHLLAPHEAPGEADSLPVDELLATAPLRAELERLGPAVREKLESTLRRYRVPPVQARLRQPQ